MGSTPISGHINESRDCVSGVVDYLPATYSGFAISSNYDVTLSGNISDQVKGDSSSNHLSQSVSW